MYRKHHTKTEGQCCKQFWANFVCKSAGTVGNNAGSKFIKDMQCERLSVGRTCDCQQWKSLETWGCWFMATHRPGCALVLSGYSSAFSTRNWCSFSASCYSKRKWMSDRMLVTINQHIHALINLLVHILSGQSMMKSHKHVSGLTGNWTHGAEFCRQLYSHWLPSAPVTTATHQLCTCLDLTASIGLPVRHDIPLWLPTIYIHMLLDK